MAQTLCSCPIRLVYTKHTMVRPAVLQYTGPVDLSRPCTFSLGEHMFLEKNDFPLPSGIGVRDYHTHISVQVYIDDTYMSE